MENEKKETAETKIDWKNLGKASIKVLGCLAIGFTGGYAIGKRRGNAQATPTAPQA